MGLPKLLGWRALWQKLVFSALQKASRIGLILMSGGIRFQMAGAMTKVSHQVIRSWMKSASLQTGVQQQQQLKIQVLEGSLTGSSIDASWLEYATGITFPINNPI